MPSKDTSARRAYKRDWDRKRYQSTADRHRVKHANRRAREFGCVGVLTVEDVAAVMAVGVCHYCEATETLGIDHVAPLHAGGPNTRENIVAACRSCNASKLRADRPGRWSQSYDACRACGRTDRAHNSGGLCVNCYVASRRPSRTHLRSVDVIEIRRRFTDGFSLEALSEAFNVHLETIRCVVTRRSWKNIP